MISQAFGHLFHTVLQSEDDLYFALSIDHLYDTLEAVVNVKELFIPVVVSFDSRESKGNVVLSCDTNNTASINYRSTARKVQSQNKKRSGAFKVSKSQNYASNAEKKICI